MSEITDEMVEAAYRAYVDTVGANTITDVKDLVRAILEAAIPHTENRITGDTEKRLREILAQEYCKHYSWHKPLINILRGIDVDITAGVALSAMRRVGSEARASTIEECAKVADEYERIWTKDWRDNWKDAEHLRGKADGASELADLIRARKSEG
jgi:hypothetical protein